MNNYNKQSNSSARCSPLTSSTTRSCASLSLPSTKSQLCSGRKVIHSIKGTSLSRCKMNSRNFSKSTWVRSNSSSLTIQLAKQTKAKLITLNRLISSRPWSISSNSPIITSPSSVKTSRRSWRRRTHSKKESLNLSNWGNNKKSIFQKNMTKRLKRQSRKRRSSRRSVRRQ